MMRHRKRIFFLKKLKQCRAQAMMEFMLALAIVFVLAWALARAYTWATGDFADRKDAYINVFNSDEFATEVDVYTPLDIIGEDTK